MSPELSSIPSATRDDCRPITPCWRRFKEQKAGKSCCHSRGHAIFWRRHGSPRAAVPDLHGRIREMKVLIISSLYPPHVVGGAEKAAAQLAGTLVRHHQGGVVVCLHADSKAVVEGRDGVRVDRLPID